MVGVSLSKNVAAEGWIAQVAERLPVTDAGGELRAPRWRRGRFGEGTNADPRDQSLTPFMQRGRFVTPIHTTLSGVGASAKTGARLGGNVVGPCDEGDATGRGQPVKAPFDPLEPTVDIALKDFGGIRSKCPKVPRATRRAGKRVGHGERLLTIGRHLGRPSRTARDGISLAATMLLDDA